MKITIRSMRVSDYAAVQDMMRDLHSMHYYERPDFYAETDTPLSSECFQHWVDDPETIALTAETDGEVAGFSTIALRLPPDNRLLVRQKTAFMENLCVRSDLRGRGVGRALYEEALQRARTAGATRLDLMVWSFNQPAVNFYKRMDMSERVVIMEKRL